MQTVGNFPDIASAQSAAAVLRGEGIESLIPDENFAGIDWQIGTALHGIRLQVAPDDFAAAEELLRAKPEMEEELPAEELCPACRSAETGPAKWKQRIKALGLFFPPVLLFWPVWATLGPLQTCRKCGHEWR
jgi:hypothetical protein